MFWCDSIYTTCVFYGYSPEVNNLLEVTSCNFKGSTLMDVCQTQRIVHVIAVPESILESIQPIAVPVCKIWNPQLTFTSDCIMFIKFIEVTI